MIINTVSIGSNYRKITVACPGLVEVPVRPGQCIFVNSRYFAVTSIRNGEFDVVLSTKKTVLDEVDVKEFCFPNDSGFINIDVPKAYLVAGGSGIGALIPLVSYRNQKGLETVLQMYGRNINKRHFVEAFSVLKDVDFECWDTTVWGRPSPEEMCPSVFPQQNFPLFFSGPVGMLEVLKRSPHNPKIHLNY